MVWVSWLLFESVAALAAVLGVALFVLLVHWRRSRRGRPLLIGLGLAVVLLVLQALVVTQREHASRILAQIEADIVRAQTDALAESLAPDFDADGRDRDAFLARVRQWMQRVDVRWLDRLHLRIEQRAADRFVVSASYRAEVMFDQIGGASRSRWALTFTRTADGWKIVDIQPLFIEGISNPSWGSIGWR